MIETLLPIGAAFLPYAIGRVVTRRLSFTSATGNALLFHGIDADPRSGLSCITPQIFEKILAGITEAGRKTCHPSDLIDKSDSQGICLTFDDGFDDIRRIALPLLLDNKQTAAVFIATAFIGKKSGWDLYRGRGMLDKQGIRELDSAGLEIGSHSHTHADLKLLSKSDLREELLRSAGVLSEITGRQTRSISFPFGSFGRRESETAAEYGMTTQCIYRGAPIAGFRQIPVLGTWRFDTATDILARLGMTDDRDGNACARSAIMPQFARGSSLWYFRKNYII